MVIAIKRKELAALSTKIVDSKYFLKGHLNLQVRSFAQAPLLIESSIVEECSESVSEECFPAAVLLQRQHASSA